MTTDQCVSVCMQHMMSRLTDAVVIVCVMLYAVANGYTIQSNRLTLNLDPSTARVTTVDASGNTASGDGGLLLFDDNDGGTEFITDTGSVGQPESNKVVWLAAPAQTPVTADCTAEVHNDGIAFVATLQNTGTSVAKVRMRLMLPVPFSGTWQCWRGKYTISSSQIDYGNLPDIENDDSGVTPFGAAYDATAGLLAGMDPDQPISMYGNGLWYESSVLYLGYEIRVVVPRNGSITRRLVCSGFDSSFAERSAVDRFWDIFPEVYYLPEDIDSSIWGMGSSIVSWYIHPKAGYPSSPTPEAADLIRRFSIGWDWFYRSIPKSMDFYFLDFLLWLRGITWSEFREALALEASPPLPGSDSATIWAAVQNLHADNQASYNTAADLGVMGLYYMQPQTLYLAELNMLFTDSLFIGPYTFGDRHAFPGGTSLGNFWRGMIPDLLSEYAIAGMGVDSAKGHIIYNGPAVNNIPSQAAYDDNGDLFVLGGAAYNKIVDDWQTQAVNNGWSVLPIIANNNEVATVPIASSIHGALSERNPLNQYRSNHIGLRYMMGRKPMVFWEDYTLGLLEFPGVDWNTLNPAEVQDVLIDRIGALMSLCWHIGAMPSHIMSSGLPQIAEYVKIMVPLYRDFGWEPIPAASASTTGTPYVSRYGDRLGSAVVVTDRYNGTAPCDLLIHHSYFDNDRYIVWADHFGDMVTQHISDATTSMSFDMQGYAPIIMRAVASIDNACNLAGATIHAEWVAAKGHEGQVRLAIDVVDQISADVEFFVPDGFQPTGVRVNGASTSFAYDGNGVVSATVTGAGPLDITCLYSPTHRLPDGESLNTLFSSLQSSGWEYQITLFEDWTGQLDAAAKLFQDFVALQHGRAGEIAVTVPAIDRQTTTGTAGICITLPNGSVHMPPDPAGGESGLVTAYEDRLTISGLQADDVDLSMRMLLDHADRLRTYCGYVSASSRGGVLTGGSDSLSASKGLKRAILLWDDPHFPFGPNGDLYDDFNGCDGQYADAALWRVTDIDDLEDEVYIDQQRARPEPTIPEYEPYAYGETAMESRFTWPSGESRTFSVKLPSPDVGDFDGTDSDFSQTLIITKPGQNVRSLYNQPLMGVQVSCRYYLNSNLYRGSVRWKNDEQVIWGNGEISTDPNYSATGIVWQELSISLKQVNGQDGFRAQLIAVYSDGSRQVKLDVEQDFGGNTWTSDTVSMYLVAAQYESHTVYFDDAQVISPVEPHTCQQIWDQGYGMAADVNRDCYINWLDVTTVMQNWSMCNDPASRHEWCQPSW